MKKVLLITRPICPPWDEASKNFAYYLAKNCQGDLEINLLTCGIISDLPENVRQRPIYTSSKFSYLQKLRLIKHLRKIRNEFNILHYLFTPTKQNSFLIKNFFSHKKSNIQKTIQTIATLREDLYSDREIKKLMFGDLIITYSEYAKNKLNALGFNNVKQVYPGIDLSVYKPAKKDLDLLRLFDLNENDFVILYEGEFVRLGFTDNLVKFIITYADELRKRRVKILFPGRLKGKEDIEKKKAVRKILEREKVMDIARFTNQVYAENDFMQKKYNLADIFIFPVQNMEGKFDIPLAVVEAMACEKPVIISDLPILSEIAKDNNSVIIPRGNVVALYKAILDLYNNPEKRAQIGQAARKFVEENFDIQKIAGIYRQIYEKL